MKVGKYCLSGESDLLLIPKESVEAYIFKDGELVGRRDLQIGKKYNVTDYTYYYKVETLNEDEEWLVLQTYGLFYNGETDFGYEEFLSSGMYKEVALQVKLMCDAEAQLKSMEMEEDLTGKDILWHDVDTELFEKVYEEMTKNYYVYTK